MHSPLSTFGRACRCGMLLALALAGGLLCAVPARAAENAPDNLAQADTLFKQQNWKDAADRYARFLAAAAPGDAAWHASLRLPLCRLRMGEYDQALADAAAAVTRFRGSAREARAERVLGNLYLTVPHWGTVKGGKFLRGRWDQGTRKETYAADRKQAVAHLERARELYIGMLAHPENVPGLKAGEAANLWRERLDAQFDLAAAVTRFGPYDRGWGRWWYAWNGEDEDTADPEEAEAERGRPEGIPVDVKGRPIWEPLPASYSPDLPPGQKLKFLLQEIERLDRSETGEYAAQALYRRAMLSRARYGADRLQQLAGWYDGGNRPYAQEVEKRRLEDLKDDEVLTLLGTRLAVVQLPADESITGLLRQAVKKYPRAASAAEAQYALGAYFQSRQQYPKALNEYMLYRELFPKGKRLAHISEQEHLIRLPEVGIEQLGVQLPGAPATLAVTYRNAAKIRFKAYPLNLAAYLDDVLARIRKDRPEDSNPYELQNLSYSLLQNRGEGKDPLYRRYLGKLAAEWTKSVADDGSHRYASARVAAPVKNRGCWLIEATVDGGNTSRNLLLLQDLAIVEKSFLGKSLHWVCDARTGSPVAGARLNYFQAWSRWEKRAGDPQPRMHWQVSEREAATNADGIALFAPDRNNNGSPQIIAIARVGDRLAFLGVNYWSSYYNPSSQWEGRRAILFTDRPVYRPGQTVRVKVWCRRYKAGAYQVPEGETLPVDVYDGRGNKLQSQAVRLDAFGGGGFDLSLGADAALGMYRIDIPDVQCAGNQFRVEEYKKPEFEVSVEPAKDLARLGEKVSGVIRARYYFGAPVNDATVTYRVYREAFTFSYQEAGPWDWLYGAGYGLAGYSYPWIFAGKPGICPPDIWHPWWMPRPAPARELVAEGQARINADGTLPFTFDTAPAKAAHPDQDHRYTVEAEVRDSSRRVITGSGTVQVTRQPFYAFVSVDRGYYQPGQQIEAQVRVITPDGKPVAAKGRVIVSRVRYRGPNNADILEEPEQRWDARADAEGRLSFSLKAGKSGQYKVAFETSAGGKPISGAAVVWVAGGDFDGRIYRFSDLEILTDKRTYTPGDTAHLMINCARSGATVLLAHHLDGGTLTNYQVLSLPNRSRTLDVPVGKGDVPNFFVEATAVFDGRVHTEAREICVPPKEGMLQLSVRTDKPEYRPGEQGHITVTARTPEGKPVKTQVALTAFDKSVLYIQPEFTPDVRAFYWGQKRSYGQQEQSSLDRAFNRLHGLEDPMDGLYRYTPEDWNGSWGRHWVNWTEDEESVLQETDGLGGGFGGGRAMRKAGAMEAEAALPSAAPSPMMAASLDQDAAKRERQNGAEAPAGAASQTSAPVRTQFADTALWLAALETDARGEASATITFPDNLTTWKVRALGMTAETRVGDAAAEAVTTKKLLVRLQAPRFFRERDRVTLSANVHNYLKQAKRVSVTLTVSDALHLGGNPTATVLAPAGGQARVDWEAVALHEGSATVKVAALSDAASDAMQMSFPVLVHGMEKTVSTTGSLPRGGKAVMDVPLEIPAERNPAASRLEVRFSPSLAGAILDAIPYLLDYPYGCTEQTLSRFLPAVLAQRTLQRMGINLETLARAHTNLNAQQLGDTTRPPQTGLSPVYDTAALNKIVRAGLARLADFQNADGGWGWWKDDQSSPYLTAYVVWGLTLAAEADAPVDAAMLARGREALRNTVQANLEEWQKQKYVANDQAFIAYVLSLSKEKNDALNAHLFEGRIHLSLYGKALLSLALRAAGQTEQADLVLQNIRQLEKSDDENQTTWFETPQNNWWFWWNNDIESNAWILKALIAKNPQDPAAPRLIKWLLNNRRNGYYWRSTRDTAVCAAAFVDYIRAVGEDKPDYTLRVLYDGRPVKDIRVAADNFLTFDNRFTLEGDALASGKHTLTIARIGDGALYYNTYLSYFTKEEGITGAGLEVKVERRYYKLVRDDRKVTVSGSRLQDVSEQRLHYQRVPLKDGDVLKSGDLVEAELRLISKNDYDYLVFEDMKAAGLEPVEVRSGAKYGELCSHMELRDERTSFFINYLNQGEHLIRYRMRAEIPGVFHALPARAWAMYAPELRANSDEWTVKVVDQ